VSSQELRQNIKSLTTIGPIISRYKSNPTDPNSPFVVVNTKATWCETVISVE
jgi:hypothetical protein